MKKSILIPIMFVAVNIFAGELVVVTGRAYGYMSNRNEVIEEAKKDALANVPFANAKLRSNWTVSRGSCTPQAMHPKCYYTASASFEDPTQFAPWTVNFTGFGRADLITDEPALTELVSIAYAKNRAKEQARFYCNREIVNPLSEWKITKDSIGYYYASNNLQCVD